MNYRGLIVWGACLTAGAIPLVTACTGPDPGAIEFVPREGSSGSTNTGGGSSTSSTSSSSGGTDAGGGGFFGGPFAFEEPQRINNLDPIPGGHVGASAPPMNGKACVAAGCHADAPKWGAGGTVYGNLAGDQPFPAALKGKVQLRINKPDGTEFGTFYPDEDGNFYLTAPNEEFPPAGSKVSIRTDDGAEKPMLTPIGGADGANCNRAGCHVNGLRIIAK